MPTMSETALTALHAALAGNLTGATVQRNGVLPVKVPAAGLVIVADGDPGTPEETLGLRSYTYEHRARIEIYVAAATEAERLSGLDDLKAEIGDILDDDRTLGGAVSFVDPEAPVTDDVPVEGAQPIKTATIEVVLTYTTSSPLA